ncbi:MAG: diaminopimelate epimerase [Candidatus Lernaella stagnicola]|nr:diaminopimelate epimerase [Candidatus Lernaella stagnicola]
MTNQKIDFVKMTGSGNDFVLIDNRRGVIDANQAAAWAAQVCRRGLGIGADGLILLHDDPDPEFDFTWRFFNSDGSEAEMCGNGGRCAVRFAYDHGLAASKEMAFRTLVGKVRGWILDGKDIRVGLTEPQDYRPKVMVSVPAGEIRLSYIDTGVPHAVWLVRDVEAADVLRLGRQIREHEEFAPRGTNVNFVQVTGPDSLSIRTYERGVEAETLACGTGCAAAAITMGLVGRVRPPVMIRTRSGDVLCVDYTQENDKITNLTFQGPVRYVARGVLDPESWE